MEYNASFKKSQTINDDMNNQTVKTKQNQWGELGPIHYHFAGEINICINIFTCTNTESCVSTISGKIHKELLIVTASVEGNFDQTSRDRTCFSLYTILLFKNLC